MMKSLGILNLVRPCGLSLIFGGILSGDAQWRGTQCKG
jgi:hypothetical protein